MIYRKFLWINRLTHIFSLTLAEVKSYRMRQLDIEYSQWKVDIDAKREIYPELNLHLVFEIKG